LRNISRVQRQKELEQRRQQEQIERQLQKQIDPDNAQDESMKQALEATEQQWKIIKPKIEKVRDLRSQANVYIRIVYTASGSSGSVKGFGIGGFGSGGFGGSSGFGGGGGVVGGGTVRKGDTAGGNTNSSDTVMPLDDTNSHKPNSPSQLGWQWLRPSQRKSAGKLTEGEKICEEFLELLEDKDANEEDIRQKMEALRKIRQEAKKELAIARQEMREVVTFRQEATLVMMRLLD